MFEGIQRGLSEAFKKLRGRGRLTEANVRDGLREVRRALLEADVNFTVANDFINRVTERSVGQEVLRTLDPSEQIVGIVYEELVKLMGPVDHSFHFAKDRPTIVMLCGLQGSGKTTTAGKLALTLQERGRKPLLVAADLQRPAAVDQLKVLGEQIKDAVNSSKAFNEALELNGVILTKLDGDARGGAALSIKEVTKVPIKWVGVGEKLDRLEEFHPERMAQRIMGQGDLMGLIEKVSRVQQEISQEELVAQQKKLAEGDFTLDDFRKQFEQMQKMGPMKDMLAQMPGGMADLIPEGEDPEESMRRIQGMIDSMTKEERRNPDIIDIGRRRRIAAGSGTEPHEIKQFVNHFDQMRTLMRQLAKKSMWERLRMVTSLGKMGAFDPGSQMLKSKVGTGHRKTAKERAEDRKKRRKQDRRRH